MTDAARRPAPTVAFLRELYVHMEWADAMIWRTVCGLDPSPDYNRLRDLLFHIHMTQRAFSQVWLNQRVELAEVKDFTSLAAIRAWAAPTYRSIHSFLGDLAEARLAEPASLPWARYFAGRVGRDPDATTLGETLFQLTSHSTYHRGQVNRRLRELGAEPPLVDYIAWIWGGRPAPQWPD